MFVEGIQKDAKNPTISEAALHERLYVELLGSAHRVNLYAEKKDTLRNYVNFGSCSHCSDVMRLLGDNVIIDFWEDEEGFLKIEKLIANGKEIDF